MPHNPFIFLTFSPPARFSSVKCAAFSKLKDVMLFFGSETLILYMLVESLSIYPYETNASLQKKNAKVDLQQYHDGAHFSV